MANLANMSRPSTFGSAIGEAARLNGEIIRNQVRTGKISHTYLLTGLKGSGKTTTARTLARALNCLDLKDGEPCGCCPNCTKIQKGETMDVREVDAARNNGVDFAKSIEEDASYQPLEMRKKVYILDECHCMTADAFSSLLKLIEEPPEWCVFIFCTTDPQKMPATIRSRCQEFRFKAVSLKEMSAHLMTTASGCGAKLDAAAAELIARHSGGSVRDALMSLEICLGEETDITEGKVNSILGIESWQQVFMMLDAVIKNNRSFIINCVDRYFSDGRRVTDVITDCMAAVTDRLRFLAGASFEGNDEYHRLVSSLDLDEELAFELADALREVYEKIRYSYDKGVLTVALLRAASVRNSSLAVRLSEAERRISELEAVVAGNAEVCVRPSHVKKPVKAMPGNEAVELPDIFGSFFMDEYPVTEKAAPSDTASCVEAADEAPAEEDAEVIPSVECTMDVPTGEDTLDVPAVGEMPVQEPVPSVPDMVDNGDGLDLPDGFFSDEPSPVFFTSDAGTGFVNAEDVPFEKVPEEVQTSEPIMEEPVAEKAEEQQDWSDGLSLDQLFDAMNNGATAEMKLTWECNTNSFLKSLIEKCDVRSEDGAVVITAPDKDIADGISCCLEVASELDGCVRVEIG